MGESSFANESELPNLVTLRFDWRPESIEFAVIAGDRGNGAIIEKQRFAPDTWRDAIPQDPLPIHLNLWLFDGQPRRGQSSMVTIHDYRPTPLERLPPLAALPTDFEILDLPNGSAVDRREWIEVHVPDPAFDELVVQVETDAWYPQLPPPVATSRATVFAAQCTFGRVQDTGIPCRLQAHARYGAHWIETPVVDVQRK